LYALGQHSHDRILAARHHALRSVGAALDTAQADGILHTDKATLCRSNVHLHSNRLLPVGSPLEERALRLLRRAREGRHRYPQTRSAPE
jgi:hypothetical protein